MSTAEVEMKPAVDTKQPEPEKMEVDTVKDPDDEIMSDIKDQIKYIEKSVYTKEPHFMARAVRSLFRLRKKMNANIFQKLINLYYPLASSHRAHFIKFLPDLTESVASPKPGKVPTIIPEVEVFLHLLLVIYLIDQNDRNNKEANLKIANLLISQIEGYNRRTMDMIAAKCYFYYSLAYEKANNLAVIRPDLLKLLRTCTLRKDTYGQCSIINLLLRNYLHYNLYDQANKLITKVNYPDEPSNNDLARYLYYLGRIKAIQLDYTAASNHLTSAIRKAPQNTAVGFKQAVHKLNIVVELLLGELPDRANFRNPEFKSCLAPYFQLTQAVRAGNLGEFNKVLAEFNKVFLQDKTHTLIVRLRHNVINTGLRRIALSYSKISLESIALKLQLGSPEDAEFIVSKAIKDAVINATVDHQSGTVTTQEVQDVYSTEEPLNQFHQRIRFCMDIRNQSVKAMRYPAKQYAQDTESAEERREREQQEIESANNLSDDEFDGF